MRDAKQEFGQIYDQCVDKIYRFIYIKVNSKEIAEDLTAETFTKSWRAFETSYNNNDPIHNPQSFCYKIARNLITDYYRVKGKASFVSLDSVQLADTSPGIEEKAMINSDIEIVMKKIANLKDEEQDVLIWYYLDEMSIVEISALLDKSESATRVTIHRALSSLRQEVSLPQKGEI